jgi:hypothetical protein
MKQNLAILLLFLFLLNSCSSTRNFELSKFKVDGKEYNELIQNRFPYYDIDSPYGDVRMGQISLDITRIENDTLSGTVTDSETKDGLLFPNIELHFKDVKDSVIVMADSMGKFKTYFPDRLQKIKVDYIGFETLIINMSDFK